MSRHTTTSALILSVRSLQENNRVATILTPSEIIDVVLYGGPKSKLRSQVSPHHTGKIWLYADKNKLTKISDFDVTAFRPSLRENLFKSWAAALCSELVIKTHAGGHQTENAYILANAFLDGLDFSSEQEGRLGLLRFLWRYHLFLGQYADIFHCTLCNDPLLLDEKEKSCGFTIINNGFICPHCLSELDKNTYLDFIISKEGIFYLQQIETISPKEVRKIQIREETMYDLRKIIFYFIEHQCDYKLKTLETNVIAF
ncbi:MAG: DNA repair protein RecO [Treponemataceae bacterium]